VAATVVYHIKEPMMIKRFRVRNYKALRDVVVDLTPIHVLIGPNDSGKTSILEAIAALCRSVDHPLDRAFTGSWEGRNLVWRGELDVPISFAATIHDNQHCFEYRLSCIFQPTGHVALVENESFKFTEMTSTEIPILSRLQNHPLSAIFRVIFNNEQVPDDQRQAARFVYDSLAGVHFYRWDPRLLGLPVAPDSNRQFRMEPSGFGLALCLDDILGYDRERFTQLEDRFREIFPQIKSIKLIPEPAFRAPTEDPEQIPMLQRADGKGIHFEFATGGKLVPAAQVSDGMLLVLAYLTVLYLPQPPRVLLVEEPENGIHPKRLQDVLKILKDVVKQQEQTQVILTTHSPYVVDLFSPEEVTLCQQMGDGSVSVRRLSESQTVRDQLDVFTLGEIWTAEGDEALSQSSRPVKEASE
jgi:predicted ATPase